MNDAEALANAGEIVVSPAVIKLLDKYHVDLGLNTFAVEATKQPASRSNRQGDFTSNAR